MSFHVGQKVVCINDQPLVVLRFLYFGFCMRKLLLDHNLNRGDIYTVVATGLIGSVNHGDVPVIWVAEATHFKHPEWGFPALQFRPVIERKTDITIFTDLLTPTSPKKLEPVT
jgi:hypothetical protein